MFNGENIVLLDFGSAVVYKYYETDDDEINSFLNDEIIKMKYDEDLGNISKLRKKGITVGTVSIKTYKELFEREHELFRLNELYIPSSLGLDLKCGFSVYPHILFDLITFYFNMYVIYILYLKKYDVDEFKSFYRQFSELILIYTTENIPTDDEIYNIDISFIIEEDDNKRYKYYSISESAISEDAKIEKIFNIYKKIYSTYIISITPAEKQHQYKYLLDGLLLIVLLLIISVKRPRPRNINFFIHTALINLLKPGFQVYLKFEEKVVFLNKLKIILENNRRIIEHTRHHFFIKMLDTKDDDVSGGHIVKQKKIKRLKKYSMKGGAEASTSTVAFISDIYESGKEKRIRIPIIDNYISMYRNKERQDLRKYFKLT